VPTTYLVTRHPGALAWLKRRLPLGQTVAHADPQLFFEQLQPGDCVAGTLPFRGAAQACQRGAKLLILHFDLPFSSRGTELSEDDLNRLGAQLVRYEVRQLE
jgi:CRISPR-associated protein Csx16